MEQVMLVAPGWEHGPVGRPRSFRERWLGLRSSDAGPSVLIETSSIHGFGMSRPFRAVGLTEALEVTDARVVEPGHMARFRGCRFVLEMPLEAEPPPAGATLEVRRV